MINTILIVLVAVVVLIVVIAVLALHFLRADDSDNFDEIPDEPRRSPRSPADAPPSPRELVPAGAERGRPRRSAPAREPWPAERPVRAGDDRASTYRERDTGPRPAVAERRDSKPAAKRAAARPAKPPRPADQDPKSSSWDSLSDVDYWAELSVDKPKITPAAAAAAPAMPAASASAARRSPDVGPDARPPRDARPPVRDETGPLPRRQRSQSARGTAAAPPGHPAAAPQPEQLDVRAARGSGSYSSEPATQSLAALARLGGQPSGPAARPAAAPRPNNGQRPGPRPAAGPRPATAQRPAGSQHPATGPRQAQPPLPAAPATQVPHPNGRSRPPVPLDDDPLTSPSFPAVNASDSRSYRTRRSPAGQSGPHTGPQSAGGRGAGGSYGDPAPPFQQYPAAQPHSQPPAPVANPYGSYVSAPQPTYQDVAPVQSDAAGYAGGYSGGWQADGTWYAGAPGSGAPGPGAPGNGAANHGAGDGDAATGYLPAPAYNGIDHGGNGYAPVDYQGVDYHGAPYQGAGYQGAAYQSGPAGAGAPGGYMPQGNFAGPYDQRGYGSPDVAYGQDGYQAHPGYGPGGR